MSPVGLLIGLPLGVLMLVLTVLGPVLFFSASIVRYRDAGALVGFGLQFLLFFSPVAYPPELVPGRWQTLYYVNPLAGCLGVLRWALVGGPLPDAGHSGRLRWRPCVLLARRTRPLPRQRARLRGHHLMSRTVIELDGVGKRYRLGEHHGRGGDLRDRLASVRRRACGAAPGRRCRSCGRCATCRSRSTRARRSASSAPTAPARARCSRSSATSPPRRTDGPGHAGGSARCSRSAPGSTAS